jgi:hypothetical protein
MSREYTHKLWDLMESGAISAQAVADMALQFMSEQDVKDMCLANDLLVDEDSSQ